jgi:hypothetical protein
MPCAEAPPAVPAPVTLPTAPIIGRTSSAVNGFSHRRHFWSRDTLRRLRSGPQLVSAPQCHSASEAARACRLGRCPAIPLSPPWGPTAGPRVHVARPPEASPRYHCDHDLGAKWPPIPLQRKGLRQTRICLYSVRTGVRVGRDIDKYVHRRAALSAIWLHEGWPPWRLGEGASRHSEP